MAAVPPVPVFLRLGDGAEHQIGSVTPDVSLDPFPADRRISSVTCSVNVYRPLAALLREAADSIDPVAAEA